MGFWSVGKPPTAATRHNPTHTYTHPNIYVAKRTTHHIGEGPEREQQEVGEGEEVVGARRGNVNLGHPLRADADLADRLRGGGVLEGEPLGVFGFCFGERGLGR